ncbi:MAG: CZB domain-containing protein, partial [Deltaproteobacteria bacterium]|nr:CZB domain-containing protein [Deltaproteobacteria bacterium]
MTIGKKIAAGIGSVLFLMIVIAIWSILGIGSIVDNADEVIYGNKLRGEVAQKEVDHLNWANHIVDLLTDDNVTTLDVQTDPTLCAFGKWLLSDARLEAEKKVPELKAVFAQIEAPHRKLHESAAAIGKVFHQADLALPGFLVAKQRDHLAWLEKLYEMMLNNLEPIELVTDPKLCAFGKFIYGEKGRALAKSDSEMGRLLEEVMPPHAEVHESAKEILKLWTPRHIGLSDILRARLDDHRVWGEHVASAIIGQQKD